MANPFPQIINSVGTLSAGHIVLATEWNTAIGGIYTYINSTLLAGGLNKMATKGDFLVFDGTDMQVLPTGGAGNDGKFLTLDSGQALGVKYASAATLTTLTTKGDLCGYSTVNARVPVGADGTYLKADSAAAVGVSWDTPIGVPLGGIILWDLSQRAMPTGFNLCDGGTYNGYVTPNTQGLFAVGAGLSVNAPAASGMGVVACGTIAGDASAGTGLGPTHAHTVSFFVGSVGSGGSSVGVSLTASKATSSNVVTPRYIALAFIMRTS